MAGRATCGAPFFAGRGGPPGRKRNGATGPYMAKGHSHHYCCGWRILEIPLERFGYRVLTGGTLDLAIGLAREPSEEIPLLLTDAGMPQMDGRVIVKAAS